MNGLTIEQADTLAEGIQPSWFDFFGAPSVIPAAAKPSAVAKVALDHASPHEQPSPPHSAKRDDNKPHRTKMHAPAKQRRARAAAAQDLRRVPPAEAVPTSDTPWGKIAFGLAGVAALIAAVVMFSGSDDSAAPEAPKASKIGPVKNGETQPPSKVTPPVAPAGDSKPEPAEPEPTEPEPAEPDPAEPDPAEPEPAEPEPAPAAEEPDPAPKPAPVAAADPSPRPVPPTPRPLPRQPKPKPKPKSGGIVRDAPF